MKMAYLLFLFFCSTSYAKPQEKCLKFVNKLLKDPKHSVLQSLETERKVFKLGKKLALPKGCFESLFIYDGNPNETSYNKIYADNLKITYTNIFKGKSFILSSFVDIISKEIANFQAAFKYSFIDPKTEKETHSQVGFIKMDGAAGKALEGSGLVVMEIFLGRELEVDGKLYRKSYR